MVEKNEVKKVCKGIKKMIKKERRGGIDKGAYGA